MPEHHEPGPEHVEFPRQADLTDPTEVGSTPESTKYHGVTTIDFIRHAKQVGGFPEAGWAHPTEEEKATLGHITPESAGEAQQVARSLVERRLDETAGNVDFLVVASPTYWLGHEELGQRAIETASIYSTEIARQLADRGLPEDRLINARHRHETEAKLNYFDEHEGTLPGDSQRLANVERRLARETSDVRPSRWMVEAQLFDVPAVLKVAEDMRAQHGGQNDEFWHAWYAGEHDAALTAVRGELASDAVHRVERQTEALIRYGESYKQATGRDLAVFVLAHHEVIQPVAMELFGIPAEGSKPGNNEGFELRIEGDRQVGTVPIPVPDQARASYRHGERTPLFERQNQASTTTGNEAEPE